jgi:hypothetical protein
VYGENIIFIFSEISAFLKNVKPYNYIQKKNIFGNQIVRNAKVSQRIL